MPLTVSEIAERIAKPGTDQAVIIGRLRHFTAEGLLQPIGQKSPGTGRRRRYDEAVLEGAAVLNELAELGVHVGLLRPALILAQDAKSHWREKKKQGIGLYLEITKYPGNPNPLVHMHEGAWIVPQGESSVVVNLTQIFGRVAQKGD
jgi:DNA-binding transcriptional MerR regulator